MHLFLSATSLSLEHKSLSGSSKSRHNMPKEADVVYSYPSKSTWQRPEHIYTEIGPPELPQRGYKAKNLTDEEELHGDDNSESPMPSTWVWMRCRRIIL